MYKNRSRGFTLIELLVVIAIIGILSAVVLASLNTARFKGNDAAIQSNLEGIRVQAELYYGNNNNTYGAVTNVCSGGMFAADTNIARAIAAADNVNGASNNVACQSDGGQQYAVAATLTTDTNTSWCVDSTGNAKKVSGPAVAVLVCP